MTSHFIRQIAFIAAFLMALVAASAIAAQIPGPTLATPSSPEKALNADGFIQRWLLLEPIAADGLTDSAVQAMVKKEHLPDQFTLVPQDGEKVTVGGAELTWHAVDTTNYNVNLFNFARAQGQEDQRRAVLGCDHYQ